MRRLSRQVVLGLAFAVGGPSFGFAQDGAAGEYSTRVWTELPATIVSETSYRSGFGTGVAASGDPVELRPGSPFVRIGGTLVQLVNPPFLEAGLLHVPAELLERP